MPKKECKICGHVQTITQCGICSLKSCQGCFEIHKYSCSTLKEDKKHFCPVHDDYVNGYCFTCFHLVCANCAVDVDKHVSHTIRSIPDALHIIRSEIPTSIEDLEKREAQEENATTKFCARRKNFEQNLPTFVNAEEKRLHKVITNAKDSLLRQILALSEKNDSHMSSSKEMITQLVAAKKNLKFVLEEKFPIAFLSEWSNPSVVIGKHEGILKYRDSPEDIVIENESEITRKFRNSILKETGDNIDMENLRTVDSHLPEIQQLPGMPENLKTGNFNHDIQFMLNTTKILPELLAKIDQWKTEGKTISLPCKYTPAINEYVKIIELVHNSIVKLKNDLLQSQNDLKKHVDNMVNWTNRETTDREEETKMYLNTINESNKKLQQYEEKLKAKEDEIRALKHSKLEKMETKSSKPLQKQNKQITDQLSKSCTEVNVLQQSLQTADVLKMESERAILYYENQNKQIRDSLDDKDKIIQSLLKEKDELQSRLSSIAGEKLTRGNPGITDLGDPNRPMKISEKYGELYDNEWTDAMVNVDLIKPHFPDFVKSDLEEIIVRHLYRTLLFCYQECKIISLKQTQTIRKTIAESLNLNIDSENAETNLPGWKEISFYRKHHGDDFAKCLITYQKLCKNILDDWHYTHKSEKYMKELMKTPFFDKCVHLCWYMAVQEPMMYLDDKLQVDTKYNKTEYKEYVQSGDKVRYIVWPALYLHENGPLLYKGVVQAYF
ncbi:uncharacterized protein LOC127715470 [Mytilus californianus]|uniref:uncharacterized protein LOC127715470 n=1 Tax=Mytilus californianus TaxID=6549 RepID=UPI0022466A6A|nr:uncharacterized protein LOC127715470 [Mytilus californianus]